MKTVFIRAIETPVEDKAAAIRAAVHHNDADGAAVRYETDPVVFKGVPKSPFAYWVSDRLLSLFKELPAVEGNGRAARLGPKTSDDFRFLRLGWEVVAAYWMLHAKGGAHSFWYSSLPLRFHWAAGGRELEAFYLGRDEAPSRNLRSREHYGRPGITWSLRSQKGFSARVLPPGSIFGQKGPALFVDGDVPTELLALLAIANSAAFRYLLEVQMSFGSYEVGVIQRSPVPELSRSDRDLLSSLARRGWALKQHLDTRSETSNAFYLPALLQADGETLVARAGAWAESSQQLQNDLEGLQSEIDDCVYRFYGISFEERRRIEHGFNPAEANESVDDVDGDDDSDDAEVAEVDAAPLVASLLSWSLGVAFGRFDVRLSTGDRPTPTEPEPFDPLPVCSPGMLAGGDGLPVQAAPPGYPLTFPSDGILVDDPGHPRDMVRAMRGVFDTIFEDPNARWHEAAELLGTPDLRTWFARDYFEQHIKRYSKSRRRAPLYWQLATPHGSYSVWLYIHRASDDTLFRVINDLVGPKLDHEKAKLDGLTQEAGANPSAAQRRDIDRQETFVTELQALKAEVARVAPLWRPNLDDGVILNFAPLWRLVPQSRGWQTECKRSWDRLTSGEYDWAHLAIQLWPERVVPKCIDDRSLAIAHGLEEVFWHEDASGTWQKSRVDESAVRRLIAERTSSTVKAALKDLLSAPTPTTGTGRMSKSRSAAPGKTAPRPAAHSPVAPTVDTAVDEATLSAVKAAIANVAEGASKADVVAATGLTDADWNNAIAVLLDRGDVSRTGQKRGTRYHIGSQGAGE